MAKTVHIYYYTTISVGYVCEVPDGIDPAQLGNLLKDREWFYEDHIVPDLADADFSGIEVDYDYWSPDYVDFTEGQVREFLGMED